MRPIYEVGMSFSLLKKNTYLLNPNGKLGTTILSWVLMDAKFTRRKGVGNGVTSQIYFPTYFLDAKWQHFGSVG